MTTRSRQGLLLTIASLLGKLGVLVTLLSISRAYGGADRSTLVFAITSSVACTALFDPQTSPLLIVRYAKRGVIPRGIWLDTHALEILGAILGVIVTLGVVVISAGAHRAFTLAGPLAVVLEAAMLEQLWRFRRVGWQVAARYGRYAAVDASIGAGRGLSGVALILGDRWIGWTILGVASVAHGAWLLRPPIRPAPRPGLTRTFRAALPYGLATTLASVYSQVPSVLAGVIVGTSAGAVLGVASRLSQPTELAAQAVATIGMQRLSTKPADSRTEYAWMIRLALIGGVVCAIGVSGIGALVAGQLGATGGAARIVMIISGVTLIPKFIDYQQVSRLIALGHIRERLLSSGIAAGVILIVLLAITAITKGDASTAEIAVSLVVLGGELLLLVVLRRATVRSDAGR